MRSTCATTSCASSKPPTRRRISRGGKRISPSSSSAPAMRVSRRSPSSPTSSRMRSATTRACATPQRWVLVDAAPKICEIPTRLGDYAARGSPGAAWRSTSGRRSSRWAQAVLSNGARIRDPDARLDGGRAREPAARELGFPLDERGRVVVDSFLRIQGRERVWALGDCAAVPNEATPGRVDPPTCRHALRQARRLAKNLTGEREPPLPDARAGGDARPLQGIADVLGVRLRGFVGWWVTRSYHLLQLPLLTRKRASSPTGRPRSSSAATSPSSPGSATRTGSVNLAPLVGLRLRTPGSRCASRTRRSSSSCTRSRPAGSTRRRRCRSASPGRTT